MLVPLLLWPTNIQYVRTSLNWSGAVLTAAQELRKCLSINSCDILARKISAPGPFFRAPQLARLQMGDS
jgi:hypothetical protein